MRLNSQAPVEFTVAPSDAVPLALKRAGLALKDVDFHEINEAFSVVALANMQVRRAFRLLEATLVFHRQSKLVLFPRGAPCRV